MMRRLALLAACAATPAAAAPGDCLPGMPAAPVQGERLAPMTFTVEPGRPRVLRASGRIEAGSAERLATALGEARVDELWLDSPGGDLAEALQMGRMLRRAGLVTRVPAGAACVGACAEAFLGGVARIVDQAGLIGFGAVPLSDPNSPQTQAERENAAARWAEQRADYYIRSGVSRGLLRLQLDVPAPGICYLSRAGMQHYNVTNAAVLVGKRRR